VAAEVLVPLQALRSSLQAGEELRQSVNRLARQFKVSTLVILRRLYDAGHLSHERFWVEYQAELERLRILPPSAGGNFYLTTTARVSKRFARAVLIATWEGRTSFSEASRLLGFKSMSTFYELSRKLGIKG
jgi:Zn-dependent peptidase ImmA (M78 family)